MKISMRTNRTGVAIVMVMFIMVILLAMGTAMLSLGTHVRLAAVRASSVISARTAADAGLTKALFEMNEKLEVTPWDNSALPQATNETLSGYNATFSYTITGDSGSGFTIESTGKSGDWAQRKVNTTLRLQGPFDRALFSDGQMEIANNARVDSYNSAAGPYGGSNMYPTSIGTNGTSSDTIRIVNNAEIIGDIVVGPGIKDLSKVVLIQQNASITGDIYAATEEKELDVIDAPSLPDRGDNPSGTITQSGKYKKILLSENEKIIIEGDVVLHITGDVELDNYASIEIKSGSSLTLYIDQKFKLSNDSSINNLAKDPTVCWVYSTATEEVQYTLDNNSDFYGALYAPNGNIEITNSGSIFGSVIADEIKVDNSGGVHYDEALKSGSVDDVGVNFVVKRWQEQ